MLCTACNSSPIGPDRDGVVLILFVLALREVVIPQKGFRDVVGVVL